MPSEQSEMTVIDATTKDVIAVQYYSYRWECPRCKGPNAMRDTTTAKGSCMHCFQDVRVKEVRYGNGAVSVPMG